MARRTTSSRSYKYLTEYYSTGSLDFRIENHGPGVAKVKVVEIFNDEYTLRPGECVTHDVVGFARVDYKSKNGTEVTVESVPGECISERGIVSDANSSLSPEEAVLEELSEKSRELIKKLTLSQREKIKRKLED